MRRKSYAKSVVAVAMAATVALSATACGLKSTADTADTSTSQSEAASSEAETPTATQHRLHPGPYARPLRRNRRQDPPTARASRAVPITAACLPARRAAMPTAAKTIPAPTRAVSPVKRPIRPKHLHRLLLLHPRLRRSPSPTLTSSASTPQAARRRAMTSTSAKSGAV